MTKRQRMLWLVPALALAACSSDPPAGGTPTDDAATTKDVAEDVGEDVAVDNGTPDSGRRDSAVDNGTPDDAGDDAAADAGDDAGDDAVTPTDTGDDAVTPADAGDDAVTPTDTGDDAVTPTDTGSDATVSDGGLDAAMDGGPADVASDMLTCATGETVCGAACVDTNTSNANCGACGNACSAGTECRGGTCVTPCRTGELRCGTMGTCTDPQTDVNNCGGCGTVCPSGQMCVSGVCNLVCTAPQTVCTAASGSRSCVNLQTDANNCGACGNACAMGLSCVAGACQLVCPTGQTACGSTCVDTATSATNCGACGNACATGQSCVMGRCQRSCATGETLCGDTCVNTATNTANCGRCGNACAAGQSCAAGTCACPTGQTLCSGTCIDTQTDTRNCGACGTACPTGQNCITGTCRATAPANDLPAGAVVLNLASPSQTLTGSTAGSANNAMCGTGGDVYYRFTLTAREVVYADTFGTTYDTVLAFAPSTGTGTVAGTCTDDSCTVLQSQLVRVLDPGTYYLVVGGYSTTGPFTLRFQHLPIGSGAVTQLTTLTGTQTLMGTTSGTGVLTQSCTAAPGPEVSYWFATCPSFTATQLTASTCGGATWDTVVEQRSAARTPLAACNDDACSTQSTVTSTLAAGAGLHTIYVDGYNAAAAGAYTLSLRFGTCTTGQTLCGAGCVDLQTSATNCGACGNACGTGQVCTAGRCGCPTGQLLCGTTCVTATTDRNNCGRCGNVCPAAQTCTAGACACATGQNLCGSACVNLQSDAANCGTCGTVCPTGSTCASGRCACPAGQTACGSTCIDLTSSNTNCGACGRVCGTGTTCQASTCRPANNDRASATLVTLGTAETTVTGTTVGATADGPTDCGGAGIPNVWYRVVLTQSEVLYADTAGSTFDTRLSLVNSLGATVANTCNDDSGCTTGGFTTTTQSRFAVLLTAGTYYINVSGFNTTSTGAFTLHVQHLPRTVGSYFYDLAITGSGSQATTLVGTSANTSATCGGTASGEDARWFVTCGAQPQFFSLCRSDSIGGVSATYTRRIGTTNYDPSMYLRSAQTGAEVACNDDGGSMGGTNCTGTGTGADTAAYGSRLNNVVAPRGLNAVLVDERTGGTGMGYTVVYTVR